MSLGPEQRRRYARHFLLPEIGVQGQERLCAAAFQAGASRAERVAATYLARAGLREDPAGRPVAAIATDDPVDAALAGAFAAVEHLKAELGVGRPGALGPDILRGGR